MEARIRPGSVLPAPLEVLQASPPLSRRQQIPL
jgi:hypothetical protein